MSTAREDDWVLAHFSDPHLTHPDGLRAADLFSKRLLGYLSWRRRRRHIHRPELLDAMIADMARIAPDHIAVTGDLTHLGTHREFAQAAAWLPRVGTPDRVTLVPGNHDAYVAEPWQRTFALWSSYMCSDQPGTGPADDPFPAFPTLRIRGDFALIGANSAVPSPLLLATGRLGGDQIEALSEVLRRTGSAGLFRILLLHHPPVPGSIHWRKRLADAARLVSVVSAQGVELVLHGHAHRSCLNWLPGPSGPVPAIGVGSASALEAEAARGAQYHVYRARRQARKWRMTMSVRRYSERDGRFTPIGDEQTVL
jgi:3',5'-cyclic AMP phosphodiesterase CpdA